MGLLGKRIAETQRRRRIQAFIQSKATRRAEALAIATSKDGGLLIHTEAERRTVTA